MTMRTVASIWRYERQGQNAQEIARLAGELCDKVSDTSTAIGTQADGLAKALRGDSQLRGERGGVAGQLALSFGGVSSGRPHNIERWHRFDEKYSMLHRK